MLYKTELKKIFGNRFFVAVLIILLLINGFLAYRTATAESNIAPDVVANFVNEYLKDPQAMDQYKKEREEAKKDFLQSPEYEAGMKFTEVMPDIYSQSDEYSDDNLITFVYNRIIPRSDEIEDKIEQVIINGKNNQRLLKRRGVEEHEFLYVYQQKAIDTYTQLKQAVVDNVDIEYPLGWSSWLEYNEGTLLLFVVLTLLGSITFGVEGKCRTLDLIRTLKKGRSHTALAKFAASVTMGAGAAVLFCMSSLIGVGLKTGYSSPTNAVQILPEYELVPFVADIWQYALIHVAGVVLAAVVFCCFSTFVAALFRGASVALSGGALFAALNLLLWRFNYKTTNNPLKYLNLFAAADGDAMFSYIHGMSVLGKYVHCWVVLLILSTLLCLIFMVTAVIMFARFGTKDVRIPRVRRLIGKTKELFSRAGQQKDKSRFRKYTGSLICAEMYKLYLCRGLIILLVALVAAKGLYSYKNYNDFFTEDSIYQEYVAELRGEWTEQKHQYINSELKWAHNILSSYEEMSRKYFSDTITRDEYYAYLKDYYRAELIIGPLERLYTTSNHLMTLSRQGIVGCFVYDTGWNKLYNREYDIFLYMLVIIATSVCFGAEYESNTSGGGFSQILRHTKRGRDKTFYAKLVAALILTFPASLVCVGFDVTNVARLWQLPDGNVPLISLVEYANAPLSLTLGQYAILVCVASAVSMLMLVLGVFAVSCLSGKLINCLMMVVIVTLVPRGLSIVGINVPVWCDYFGVQQVDLLAKWSMKADILGHAGGFCLILLSWTVMITVLMTAAHIKWIGRRQ